MLRPDQLEEEFKGCLDLAKYCLDTVGMLDKCTFRFSQWDPDNTAKYEGTAEQWNEAQRVMGQILDDLGVNYEIGIDEAAFYGPICVFSTSRRHRSISKMSACRKMSMSR